MLTDNCYSHSEATIQRCLDDLQALFPASIKYARAKNRRIVVNLKTSSKAADFERWVKPNSKSLGVDVRNDKTSLGVRGRGGRFKGAWPLVWITPPRDFTDAEIKSFFELLQTWPHFQTNQILQRHGNLYRKRVKPNDAM